ncbi:TraK family protein [Halodesulfovibrio aestuarii]|uniref:TraK family protein n=1 Tax=Halodesulfovibrio aestuarii TaxID=126333 RepID=UPI003D328341
MPKKANRKGFAKVEFLAVQPEVIKLLKAGHTFRSAYEMVRSENKITMSYQRFTWYARNGVKSRLEEPVKRNTTQKATEEISTRKALPAATLPADLLPVVPQKQLTIPAEQDQQLGVTKRDGKSFKEVADSVTPEDIY